MSSDLSDPNLPPSGWRTPTGVFVCFEGGDGAGKSTQCELLRAGLVEAGYDVLLTFEPGDTEVGRELRRIVLDPATGDLSDRTEVLLYAADKAEHVDTVVLPALEAGRVVITDRYVDSMLAYQGAGRELGVAAIEGVARWATGDLRPHLTVLLDVAPDQGLHRFAGRDRIEAESVRFHERARAAYLELAAADPEHYLVVDGRRPLNEIGDVVLAAVSAYLEQAASRAEDRADDWGDGR